jgi:hypothetical protein
LIEDGNRSLERILTFPELSPVPVDVITRKLDMEKNINGTMWEQRKGKELLVKNNFIEHFDDHLVPEKDDDDDDQKTKTKKKKKKKKKKAQLLMSRFAFVFTFFASVFN